MKKVIKTVCFFLVMSIMLTSCASISSAYSLGYQMLFSELMDYEKEWQLQIFGDKELKELKKRITELEKKIEELRKKLDGLEKKYDIDDGMNNKNDRKKGSIPPVLKYGSFLIPTRVFLKVPGLELDWNKDEKTLTAVKGKDKLVIKLESGEIYFNGKKLDLDQYVSEYKWKNKKIKHIPVSVLIKILKDKLGIDEDDFPDKEDKGLISKPAVLEGTVENAPSTVNLSLYGKTDWVHWGLDGVSSVNRKSQANNKTYISDYTAVGTGTTSWVSMGNPVKYSWTGGTPISEASGVNSAIYVSNKGCGFQFTVPADTKERVLKVYVAAWDATGTFEASLSDNSALPYTVDIDSDSGIKCKVITIRYKAQSDGRKLTVKYTVKDNKGSSINNISLQAAALSEQ